MDKLENAIEKKEKNKPRSFGKHPGGRPPIYCDEILEKARAYIENWHKEEALPQIASLALILGVKRETIREWATSHEEFSTIYSDLMAAQEKELISRGLKSEFNSPLTKLILTKHGYHDRVEQAIYTPKPGDSAPWEILPVAGRTIEGELDLVKLCDEGDK